MLARLIHPAALLIALALGAGVQLTCHAGARRDVLVVANAGSPVSRAIADYYIARRRLPADQLVLLDIPTRAPDLATSQHEAIGRADFEDRVRGPIERFLVDHDLVGQIHILVTTKGVPLRIEGPATAPADLLRASTAASVDAELSLLFGPGIGSPGVAHSLNPYFDSPLAFDVFLRRNPDSPLRYLVARLTGYQSELDPETGVPRDVKALIDRAQAPVEGAGRWLIDEDPSLPPGMDAGNRALLGPAAAGLAARGLDVVHDEGPAFSSDVEAIQGYASWGSNAGHEAAPHTYGEIGGHRYPGRFAPRALAIDLVSTNARSFTAPPNYGQSLVADLIAAGAAGAPGHVEEPTLNAIAHPRILLGRYAEGVIAIEAFYRSIPYLGWMNVYVGDPLMQLPEALVVDPDSARDDSDGDGVRDGEDNCLYVPNPRQRDTDGDLIGNDCDADVTGDGLVTTSWGRVFPRGARGDLEWIALTARNGPYDPDHDLDGDGKVDERDVAITQLLLFRPPGPGRADATSPPSR